MGWGRWGKKKSIAWRLTVCGAFTELMVWDLTDSNSVVRYSMSWPEAPSGTTGTTELDMDLDICITALSGFWKHLPLIAGMWSLSRLPKEPIVWQNWKNLTAHHSAHCEKKKNVHWKESKMERVWIAANKLWCVIEAVSSICWEKEKEKITRQGRWSVCVLLILPCRHFGAYAAQRDWTNKTCTSSVPWINKG